MTSLKFSFSLQSRVFYPAACGWQKSKVLIICYFCVQTSGAGISQDEKTSLEQNSRQKNDGTNWVSALAADSGVGNAIDSAPKHPIAPKVGRIQASIHFY